MYTLEQIKKVFATKGYKFYEEPYKLNIIGIRNAKGTLNQFDDTLYVIFKDNTGATTIKAWPLTTEAGLPFFLKPLNPKGTAVLCTGQYIDVYQIAKHQGKYDALCQRGKLMVYRDNNKDNKVDYVNLQESYADGINIHSTKPNLINKIVNDWSAACQVLVNWADFQEFMTLCYRQKDLYGNKFTYTLIRTNEIV